MNFKKDYFIRHLIDLGMSFGEYVNKADFNYVIFDKGQVMVWGDKSPVIFCDEMAVLNELGENGGLDDDGHLLPDIEVMTEQDFLFTYCYDALVSYIIDLVIRKGKHDEYFYAWFVRGLEGEIIFGNYTKVEGVFIDKKSRKMNILITDDSGNEQKFVDFSELGMDLQIKMINKL